MEKLKLIGEDSQWDIKDYKIISEAANAGEEKRTYIQGPFTEAGSKNRNQRIYPLESMVEQINEFNQNYILTHRATGELEHPEYPNLNAANACHLITEIKQDGNIFIGKSKILDTPKGQIVKALLHDGVQLGVSSRSLVPWMNPPALLQISSCVHLILSMTLLVKRHMLTALWNPRNGCAITTRSTSVYTRNSRIDS